jgi:hypothetical protein
LPDDVHLWRLANARTKQFFDREKAVVMACFKRIEDGEKFWIYNERMLTVIKEQTQKVENKGRGNRKSSGTVSVSISSLVSGLALSIYEDYPRKEGKRKAIEEIEKAIVRYAKEKGIEELDAAEYIHAATAEFAKSPAGRKRSNRGENLVPHPSTWFHQDRFSDDRAQWYVETQEQQQKPALAVVTQRSASDILREMEGGTYGD